ncbi:MAG: monofunctional biosynthetic peptidoglycan transglycosylase, partial [Bacillota bacterium]
MNKLRKLLPWLVILPVLFVLVMQLYFFLQIWWWVDHNPESTSFMRHQLSVL